MEDAERDAEAALLALGGVLEWEDAEGGSQAILFAGRLRFLVRNEVDTGLWRTVRMDFATGDGIVIDGPRYKTRHAAKVACAWHELTGDWEHQPGSHWVMKWVSVGEPDEVVACTRRGQYRIRLAGRYSVVCYNYSGNADRCPKAFEDPGAATAACECHYATGKWE